MHNLGRTGGGPNITGEMYLFVGGTNYQGYVRDLTSGGNPVNNPLSYAQGHMTNDGLTFYNTGQYQGQDYIMYIIITPFSLSMGTVSGVWYAIATSSGSLGPVGTVGGQGTMTMTATN